MIHVAPYLKDFNRIGKNMLQSLEFKVVLKGCYEKIYASDDLYVREP